MQRAGPGQHGDLLAFVQHPGGGLQVLHPGAAGRGQVDRCGRRRPGRRHVLVRVLVRVGHLQVVGEAQMRDAAAGQRGADRDVHHPGQLRGVLDHQVVLGHIGVQLVGVHLLLVTGAQHGGLLHPGDGQHRHVVQLGVVQAVQQVNGTGTGRGQADAELAGRLGVGGGHERGGFFVVHEEEPHPVGVPAQAFHDPVDAITRQAEDRVDPPLSQPLDQQLGCDLRH